MTTFEEILQRALSTKGAKLPADTIVDLKSKGVNLVGSITVRMQDEGVVEDSEIVEQAMAAALRRVDDILDGIISLDVLDGNFFTKTTRTAQRGEVEIPTKLAGIQGADGKFLSAINLSRLLNITLFTHVKDLMVEPALKYRTGRFANSVHINGISLNPQATASKGSIFFSYMLFPYQVFAGHSTRDPGSLIRDAISNALRKALHPNSFKRLNLAITEGR